jgi:hypothetical protein
MPNNYTKTYFAFGEWRASQSILFLQPKQGGVMGFKIEGALIWGFIGKNEVTPTFN